MTLDVRSVREAASSSGSKTRREVMQSAFQVICPSDLRHARRGIFPEQPRPATTAMGTSRHGHVVSGRLVQGLIGQFRELAQRLRKACHVGWLAASAGVARIKSTQARLDWARFDECQSP